MTRLELDVLAVVVESPGATSRIVAGKVLADGLDPRQRQRVSRALRNLVSMGGLTFTIRARSGAMGAAAHCYWPVEGFNAPSDLVHLTFEQRHLIRHLLRRGLAAGQLGPPSAALLAHLDAEEARIERGPAP